jgi:chromosome segregation ATPase
MKIKRMFKKLGQRGTWIVNRNMPRIVPDKDWRKISQQRITHRNAPYEKRINAEVKRLEKRIATLEGRLDKLQYKIGGWQSKLEYVEQKSAIVSELNKLKSRLRAMKDPTKIWYDERLGL